MSTEISRTRLGLVDSFETSLGQVSRGLVLARLVMYHEEALGGAYHSDREDIVFDLLERLEGDFHGLCDIWFSLRSLPKE